jgi:hypothetical protein
VKASGYYGSKTIKAADLPPKGLTAVIKDVIEEDYEEDKGTRTKLTLELVDVEKRLVLNASNATTIIDALGDETDDWIGATIHLGTHSVMFNGSKVKGICIKSVTPPGADTAVEGK